VVTRTRHIATSYVHCLSCLHFHCSGLCGHNVNNTHFYVIGHCPVSHGVIRRHQLTPAPTLPTLQLVDLGRAEMSAVHITFGPDGYIHCWLNKSKRIGEAWFPEIGLNRPLDLTFLSCVSPFFSCPIFFIFPWKCLCTTKKIRVCEFVSVRRRMADFFLRLVRTQMVRCVDTEFMKCPATCRSNC
jgi:hypothetical protein